MFILLAKGSIAGPSHFMSLYMYQLILLEEYTQDRVVLCNMGFFSISLSSWDQVKLGFAFNNFYKYYVKECRDVWF